MVNRGLTSIFVKKANVCGKIILKMQLVREYRGFYD